MNIEKGYLNLLKVIKSQLKNNFLLEKAESDILSKVFEGALIKTENCFSKLKNKYYKKNGEVYFNPYQSSQYCIFLYFLSSEISKLDTILADKVYYLNKMLNGIDLYHQVIMPNVFSLDHPVGSVVGKGKFNGRIHISQNCTIGNNKNIYPEFGDNVILLANSIVIGKCKIGDNVIIAAKTYIKDENIPSNSIVFGKSPNLIVKPLIKNLREIYKIF